MSDRCVYVDFDKKEQCILVPAHLIPHVFPSDLPEDDDE